MENINELKNLIQKVSEISKRYEEVNKVSGNNFNVFNVINVTTDEVRLHSRFLAELLNPIGSHGQEDVFLKLFVDYFNIEIDTTSSKAYIEKYIGTKSETSGGFLDIYIEDAKGKNFIIENKIYAPDQENQLLRYYNFKKDNILYLTLFGEAPSDKSYGSLQLDKDFKLISYKTDIIKWLLACRKEAVEMPLLREGITHYINLLKTLTGQSISSKMKSEIKDFITSSSDNLKGAWQVQESFIDAKIKIQWAFWESLKTKMKSKGIELIEDYKVTIENVQGYYQKTRLADIGYGFWVDLGTKENKKIYFIIEINQFVYFGFKVFKDGKGGLALEDENAKYRKLVSEINQTYEANNYWLGARYTEERLDFRNFNSDAIFNLADSDKLDKTTTTIADNIKNDIEAFKLELENI